MHLGLVTYNLAADWDIEKIIEVCEATGHEAVELRTTHAHGVEPDLTEQQRHDVRRRFESSNVVLLGLGSTCEYHSPDLAELAAQKQSTMEFIDLAQDIGAQGVKVRPNRLVEDVPVAQTLRQIGESLQEAGEYAETRGMKIWLEIHGQGTCEFPHPKTIIEYVQSPAVSLCWNCNPTDVVDGSIRENFRLVMDRIGLVHIHDLYDDYPYAELIALLRSIGYEGYCMSETPGSDDAERVMQYYAALWREMTS
jgi:sugar phosphate isomerase/epimerase